MISRRTFLAGLGAMIAAPLAARAQQAGRAVHVGLFHVGLDHEPPSLPTLREALKTLGYEDGKNMRLDWRNLPDEDAAREVAKEFVRQRVDVIVAFEDQTLRAAKAATSKIPVVFLHVSDPVATGMVKSLAHPGGNMTGFVTWPVTEAKQVELFKELVPPLRRLLVLIDPNDPVVHGEMADIRKAGSTLKVQLVEREAISQADVERAVRSIIRRDVDGIFVPSPTLRVKFSSVLIRLASERRLPLHSHRKEWVEQGALFSYAPDLASIGPLAARYIDRILRGAKPGDLPVEQPTKFELVINLKTAKALGLTIPQSVLIRADQVIE